MKTLLIYIYIIKVLAYSGRFAVYDIKGIFNAFQYILRKKEDNSLGSTILHVKKSNELCGIMCEDELLWRKERKKEECQDVVVTKHQGKAKLLILQIQHFKRFYTVVRLRHFLGVWVPVSKGLYNKIDKIVSGRLDYNDTETKLELTEEFDQIKYFVSNFRVDDEKRTRIYTRSGFKITKVTYGDTLVWEKNDYQEEVIQIEIVKTDSNIQRFYIRYETYYGTADTVFFICDPQPNQVNRKDYFLDDDDDDDDSDDDDFPGGDGRLIGPTGTGLSRPTGTLPAPSGQTSQTGSFHIAIGSTSSRPTSPINFGQKQLVPLPTDARPPTPIPEPPKLQAPVPPDHFPKGILHRVEMDNAHIPLSGTPSVGRGALAKKIRATKTAVPEVVTTAQSAPTHYVPGQPLYTPAGTTQPIQGPLPPTQQIQGTQVPYQQIQLQPVPGQPIVRIPGQQQPQTIQLQPLPGQPVVRVPGQQQPQIVQLQPLAGQPIVRIPGQQQQPQAVQGIQVPGQQIVRVPLQQIPGQPILRMPAQQPTQPVQRPQVPGQGIIRLQVPHQQTQIFHGIQIPGQPIQLQPVTGQPIVRVPGQQQPQIVQLQPLAGQPIVRIPGQQQQPQAVQRPQVPGQPVVRVPGQQQPQIVQGIQVPGQPVVRVPGQQQPQIVQGIQVPGQQIQIQQVQGPQIPLQQIQLQPVPGQPIVRVPGQQQPQIVQGIQVPGQQILLVPRQQQPTQPILRMPAQPILRPTGQPQHGIGPQRPRLGVPSTLIQPPPPRPSGFTPYNIIQGMGAQRFPTGQAVNISEPVSSSDPTTSSSTPGIEVQPPIVIEDDSDSEDSDVFEIHERDGGEEVTTTGTNIDDYLDFLTQQATCSTTKTSSKTTTGSKGVLTVTSSTPTQGPPFSSSTQLNLFVDAAVNRPTGFGLSEQGPASSAGSEGTISIAGSDDFNPSEGQEWIDIDKIPQVVTTDFSFEEIAELSLSLASSVESGSTGKTPEQSPYGKPELSSVVVRGVPGPRYPGGSTVKRPFYKESAGTIPGIRPRILTDTQRIRAPISGPGHTESESSLDGSPSKKRKRTEDVPQQPTSSVGSTTAGGMGSQLTYPGQIPYQPRHPTQHQYVPRPMGPTPPSQTPQTTTPQGTGFYGPVQQTPGQYGPSQTGQTQHPGTPQGPVMYGPMQQGQPRMSQPGQPPYHGTPQAPGNYGPNQPVQNHPYQTQYHPGQQSQQLMQTNFRPPQSGQTQQAPGHPTQPQNVPRQVGPIPPIRTQHPQTQQVPGNYGPMGQGQSGTGQQGQGQYNPNQQGQGPQQPTQQYSHYAPTQQPQSTQNLFISDQTMTSLTGDTQGGGWPQQFQGTQQSGIPGPEDDDSSDEDSDDDNFFVTEQAGISSDGQTPSTQFPNVGTGPGQFPPVGPTPSVHHAPIFTPPVGVPQSIYETQQSGGSQQSGSSHYVPDGSKKQKRKEKPRKNVGPGGYAPVYRLPVGDRDGGDDVDSECFELSDSDDDETTGASKKKKDKHEDQDKSERVKNILRPSLLGQVSQLHGTTQASGTQQTGGSGSTGPDSGKSKKSKQTEKQGTDQNALQNIDPKDVRPDDDPFGQFRKDGFPLDLLELDDSKKNYVVYVDKPLQVPVIRIIPSDDSYIQELNLGSLIIWRSETVKCVSVRLVVTQFFFGAVELTLVTPMRKKFHLFFRYTDGYYRGVARPRFNEAIYEQATSVREMKKLSRRIDKEIKEEQQAKKEALEESGRQVQLVETEQEDDEGPEDRSWDIQEIIVKENGNHTNIVRGPKNVTQRR